MAALVSGIHTKGLEAGITLQACAGGAGSLGNEVAHAQQVVVTWGFDYVKYDGSCYKKPKSGGKSLINRFTTMSRALKAANKAVVIEIDTGADADGIAAAAWASNIATVWRTTTHTEKGKEKVTLKSIHADFKVNNQYAYAYGRGGFNSPGYISLNPNLVGA